MNIELNGTSYNFIPIPLEFMERDIVDIFCKKNNKTLAQTLEHRRYTALNEIFRNSYSEYKDQKVGNFLGDLKRRNNNDYSFFLNKYGDEKYCRFHIREHLRERGLYCFALGGQIKYIGRCIDSYGKRINQGYGNITGKKCFKDGQSTNCRINSLINSNREVQFGIYPMVASIDEIKELERQFLINPNYSWNIY